MEYGELAELYSRIEATTKRTEMIGYLSEVIKKTSSSEIDKIIYLTQGRIGPRYEGLELGIAEKLVIKALSFATGYSEKRIYNMYVKSGDLGAVAEDVVRKKMQTALFTETLELKKVFSNFMKIASAKGSGAQELKIKLLSDLLHSATPLEAKYITRTVIGKLRLGIADMSMIEALSIAVASKEAKDEIEYAYNLCSDLGKVAKILLMEGLEGVRKIDVQVGIPVRPMLAERLSSINEILEKLEGKASFEYKYDGLRMQVHISKERILLFSRQLENITKQFPDIIKAVEESFKGETCIAEGECVPYNVETGEFLPFQQVSHRRGRIYDLESAMEEYPVKLILFDCLYLNGESYVKKRYLERRKMLNVFKESERIGVSEMLLTDNIDEAEKFFIKATESGCEGLLAKAIDSHYSAGARGWQWIKYKRDYKSEMTDTVDLVIVGGFAGRGRRSGVYGAYLMAAYNSEKDVFETVCKLGSGFTDKMLIDFKRIVDEKIIEKKHARVISNISPDVWFLPEVVLEVSGAEITLSPVHTCAYNKIKEDTGLAIRFPRYTGKVRHDKSPEDATTTKEIIDMYRQQLKKVA